MPGMNSKTTKGTKKTTNSLDKSGQIIATSHDLTLKGSFLERNSPYFREMQVGEILFHLAR